MIRTKRTSEPQQLSVPVIPSPVDIYPLFDQHFSSKAKSALSKRSYNIIEQWNEPAGDIRLVAKDNMVQLLAKLDIKSTKHYVYQGQYVRKISRAHCFGFVTSEDKVANAALKLVDVINHMAKFNFIRSSMMNLSLFELGDINDPSIKRYAVVSYLSVPCDLEQQVKSVYGPYMFEEGGIPPEYK